jgi:two-component system chemotaxis response regulator CheY
MHALVVDDSRAMRTLIGRMLKQLGFEILEAGHGQEALERLRTGPQPAVAMIDWNMPMMNGLELVKAIRNEPRWQAVTLVMVTTESELGQVEKALLAGASEYVMKPFTADILLGKLSLLGLTPAETAVAS